VGDPACLHGKIFVITGQLDSLDRPAAEDFIMRHGGTVRTTVSSKTGYLVVGQDAGASKTEKAQKFKTACLTEDQLIGLVADLSRKAGVDPWAWKTGGGAPTIPDDDEPMAMDVTASVVASSSSTLATLLTPAKPAAIYRTPSPPPSRPSHVAPHPPEATAVADEWLWADKYRPRSFKDGMVVPPQATELKRWLESWRENASKHPPPPNFKRAALLSGPPGIGKTTSAHLAGHECGYEVVEWNASDKRSKRDIDETILDMVNNASIMGLFRRSSGPEKRCCVIMDEVDGCDRGGIGEVIQMIHRTKVPIICICNDRYHPKVKSLVNHCVDLKFNRPNRTQVAAHLQRVLRLEGHDMPLPTLETLVTSCNNDLRSLLNSLQMWFKTRRNIGHDEARGLQAASSKDLEPGTFDAAEKFLTPQTPKLSLAQLRDIFFSTDFMALYVQENYLNMKPEQCRSQRERMDLLTRAADSIALGDVSDTLIHREQHWALSSVGVFQSASYPSALVRGRYEPLKQAAGWADQRIRFPSWLGQNSSRKKNERLIACIAKAARNPLTGATGPSAEMRMYYFSLFAHYVTQPLATRGKEGIDDVCAFMDQYHLGRDDWDLFQELRQWKKAPLGLSPPPAIDTATRSAFTRTFNKTHLMSAVKAVSQPKGRGGAAEAAAEDGDGGDDDAASQENEEDDDPLADAMIVAKKKPAAAASSSSAAGKAPKKGARAAKPPKG